MPIDKSKMLSGASSDNTDQWMKPTTQRFRHHPHEDFTYNPPLLLQGKDTSSEISNAAEKGKGLTSAERKNLSGRRAIGEDGNLVQRTVELASISTPEHPILPGGMWRRLLTKKHLDNQGSTSGGSRSEYENLAIHKDQLDQKNEARVTALNRQASTCYWKKEYGKAEQLYHQVLAIQEQELGPGHRDTAYTLELLGDSCEKQGKYEEAEQLCQRKLRILKEDFESEFGSIVAALEHLGDLQEKQNKHSQAKRSYKCAISVCDVNDKKGINYKDILEKLAKIYKEKGKHGKVEQLYEHALQSWVNNEKFEVMDYILENLAKIYKEKGKHEEVEQLYEHAIDFYRKEYSFPGFDPEERIHKRVPSLRGFRRPEPPERPQRDVPTTSSDEVLSSPSACEARSPEQAKRMRQETQPEGEKHTQMEQLFDKMQKAIEEHFQRQMEERISQEVQQQFQRKMMIQEERIGQEEQQRLQQEHTRVQEELRQTQQERNQAQQELRQTQQERNQAQQELRQTQQERNQAQEQIRIQEEQIRQYIRSEGQQQREELRVREEQLQEDLREAKRHQIDLQSRIQRIKNNIQYIQIAQEGPPTEVMKYQIRNVLNDNEPLVGERLQRLHRNVQSELQSLGLQPRGILLEFGHQLEEQMKKNDRPEWEIVQAMKEIQHWLAGNRPLA